MNGLKLFAKDENQLNSLKTFSSGYKDGVWTLEMCDTGNETWKTCNYPKKRNAEGN